MNGGLTLEIGRGPHGPRVNRSEHRVPFHLGKVHAEGDALVAFAVNPTAGFFEGDRAVLDVRVEGGGRLTLATPSANRIHPARGTGRAELEQRFHVGAGSCLEYFPEALIPFAGARYRQHTEITAERGSILLWFDWMLPGRLARGEGFAFHELQLSLDVHLDGVLCLHERARLCAEDGSLAPWRAAGAEATVVTALLHGIPLDQVRAVAEPLHGDGVSLGAGPLAHAGVIIRALCATPLHARRLLVTLRQGLYAAMDRPMPRLGIF